MLLGIGLPPAVCGVRSVMASFAKDSGSGACEAEDKLINGAGLLLLSTVPLFAGVFNLVKLAEWTIAPEARFAMYAIEVIKNMAC